MCDEFVVDLVQFLYISYDGSILRSDGDGMEPGCEFMLRAFPEGFFHIEGVDGVSRGLTYRLGFSHIGEQIVRMSEQVPLTVLRDVHDMQLKHRTQGGLKFQNNMTCIC